MSIGIPTLHRLHLCNNYTEITPQEYHFREPSEEDDGPLWIQTGPEYPSDYTGDGPDSFVEYNSEKEKAGKRKRNIEQQCGG